MCPLCIYTTPQNPKNFKDSIEFRYEYLKVGFQAWLEIVPDN